MLFKSQKKRFSSLCLQKAFLHGSVSAEMWGCAHMVNGADSPEESGAVPNSCPGWGEALRKQSRACWPLRVCQLPALPGTAQLSHLLQGSWAAVAIPSSLTHTLSSPSDTWAMNCTFYFRNYSERGLGATCSPAYPGNLNSLNLQDSIVLWSLCVWYVCTSLRLVSVPSGTREKGLRNISCEGAKQTEPGFTQPWQGKGNTQEMLSEHRTALFTGMAVEHRFQEAVEPPSEEIAKSCPTCPGQLSLTTQCQRPLLTCEMEILIITAPRVSPGLWLNASDS